MKISTGQVRLGASDLSNHLACRHVTTLDLQVARGERAAPDWAAPDLKVIQELGLRHEAAYLAHLSKQGLTVENLGHIDHQDEKLLLAKTLDLMERGAEVIAQGKTLLIFPEGTRSSDGEVHEFKPLIGQLALTYGIDLLPLYLGGTHATMPKGAPVPYKREILARIERYHTPYHRELDEACDRLHRKFGVVWHINCHSMPSQGNRREGRRGERGDFVLGDRDGTTCAPEFTEFVARFLRGLRYDVRVNEGYKGVEIVRRQGRPAAGRHSLQIEVDRSLYMDQKTLEKLPGFDRLKSDLTGLVAALGDFVRAPR